MVKKSRFQEVRIPLGNGEGLYSTFLKPNNEPDRVVFIPPLIGANAELQTATFRSLANNGSEIFSFEYRGHRRSSGNFSLENSIEDTGSALKWINQYSENRNLPLHVVTMCYGTIPLLLSLQKSEDGLNIRSVNGVSSLFSLDYILKVEALLPFILNEVVNKKVEHDRLAGMVKSGEVDVTTTGFVRSVSDYLKGIFPDLDIGEDHFAELKYGRTDIRGVISQFLTGFSIDAKVPKSISCNFFYGARDSILGLTSREKKDKYVLDARRIAPHAQLHEVDIDHFGKGQGRQAVLESLCDIFGKVDASCKK